ncbi:MAG: alanine/glycine:cation symporter family protein, partial [Fibrobacterota bacterium]
MESLNKILTSWNEFLWGFPMLFALMGTHLYLTFRLGFIQQYIFRGIKLSLEKKPEGAGDISHFGALATSLAATIGTGNIVGVATAVAAGGPGAVFWMWITGVFGIATKYSEAFLSVKYRITLPNGQMAGGPMYVLERGLKSKPLGLIFALFTAVAAFGIGNTVQSSAIAGMMKENFSISPFITGAALTILTALVILGGIRTIASTCEKLVPFMAALYIVGCIIILALRYDQILPTIGLIVSSAFTGQAALGGFLGVTMRQALRFGVSRGLFSNESGMGSAPIVAAAARTSNPARQALVSATGTFWDTVIVCALTGLVIVSSGEWISGIGGEALSRAAFGSTLSSFGSAMLTFGLLTFVFSTILGWSYYGEKAVEYLFGHKVVMPYRYLWVAAVMVGAVVKSEIVWNFADVANVLMAVPNILSLLLLSGIVAAESKIYLRKGARNKDMERDLEESVVTKQIRTVR